MLKIYDSLSREKKEFVPVDPSRKKVTMYVCGVTVYDYCHIGHARTYVAFDMIYRYLSFIGYKVNYVRNITDIDDKIIKRAQERKEPTDVLAQQFIDIMHEDFKSLGLKPPKSEPKATETIDEIISFIENLIVKKYAYIGTNGDVYFAVKDYKDYGQLAQQSLDSLLSGARVEKNEAKRDPLDFVLWKMAKKNEPYWDSPWGAGRPGWHIECSAMSHKMLGETIDIHGGGFDLKFPHHENERAQSEARNNKKFVNYWLHAGFLQIDNEKMSKSLKNFLTIREALNTFPAELLRCFLVMSQYRSEINYSDYSVNQTKKALDRLYNAIRDINLVKVDLDNLDSADPIIKKYFASFNRAMEDDFNTPEAFAIMFDMAREINKLESTDKNKAGELGFLLKKFGKIFGILQQDPEEYLKADSNVNQDLTTQALSVAEIEGLIRQREQARLNKEYKKSDEIRNQLLENGIILEDNAHGTKWRRTCSF
ncbi:MAG: cysteine--tRNA ligase [Gammaproteobacteria bacterium]|nr:cysteine--tRNA ligase [Gammaproteobacteria bacterium]